MKSSITIRLHSILVAVLLLAVVEFATIYSSFLNTNSSHIKGPGHAKGIAANISSFTEQQSYFSSADFSLTHKEGKNESRGQSYYSPLQREKIIRPEIFDVERITSCSLRTAWFTQSTYLVTLAPLWHPSIPIAHRKLVI